MGRGSSCRPSSGRHCWLECSTGSAPTPPAPEPSPTPQKACTICRMMCIANQLLGAYCFRPGFLGDINVRHWSIAFLKRGNESTLGVRKPRVDFKEVIVLVFVSFPFRKTSQHNYSLFSTPNEKARFLFISHYHTPSREHMTHTHTLLWSSFFQVCGRRQVSLHLPMHLPMHPLLSSGRRTSGWSSAPFTFYLSSCWRRS